MSVQHLSSHRSHNETDYQDILGELSAVQGKLSGKVEALLMVSSELGRCEAERARWEAAAATGEDKVHQLDSLLCATKDAADAAVADWAAEKCALERRIKALGDDNKRLQDDCTALKATLKDARGDAAVLRQKLARLELAEAAPATSAADRATLRSLSAHDGDFFAEAERAPEAAPDPLEELERQRERLAQMELDLRGVLCEKEELVSEREEYKGKVTRLSQEMAFIMNGHESRVVSDLDGIIAENRYLKAQLASAKEETGLTQAALNKYRNLVDSSKRSLSRSGSGEQFGLPSKAGATVDKPRPTVVTPKQVRDLLGDNAVNTTDYRSLATALFDSVKDKSLALSHQRKTNK